MPADIWTLRMTCDEQWRFVAGTNEAYSVSNLGRVRSNSRTVYKANGTTQYVKERILKFGGSEGRPTVTLAYKGKAKPKLVCRVVCETWLGERPKGQVTRHLNDNPQDNRVSNLCYGTPKQNGEDMVRNGNSLRGTRCPHAVLTEEKVKDIRALYLCYTAPELAKKFKVSLPTIRAVLARKVWGWV